MGVEDSDHLVHGDGAIGDEAIFRTHPGHRFVCEALNFCTNRFSCAYFKGILVIEAVLDAQKNLPQAQLIGAEDLGGGGFRIYAGIIGAHQLRKALNC